MTEKRLECHEDLPKRYLSILLADHLPQTAHLPDKDRYLQACKHDGSITDLVVSGEVTIDRSGREGTYRLTFKNHSVESGTFEVNRCETYLLCG